MKHLSFSTTVSLAILIMLGTAGYFSLPWNKSALTRPSGVACTMEAKLCPDGSYVGRRGPNCEFAACPSVVPTTTVDRRTPLTPELLSSLWKQRHEQFSLILNEDPANTVASYQGHGISLNLPFNNAWGTTEYSILPYEEEGLNVLFGNYMYFEAGSLIRTKILTFIPARSAVQAVAVIQKDPELVNQPTTVKINGLTVIRYETAGLCNYPRLEIIGRVNNYLISNACGGTFDELETIVSTARLID